MTTKILALTDALGNLVRFVLLPGQRFDTVGVEPLIEGLSFDALIADRAFDSNSIIAELNERGAKIVISQVRIGESTRRASLCSGGHLPHKEGEIGQSPLPRTLPSVPASLPLQHRVQRR